MASPVRSNEVLLEVKAMVLAAGVGSRLEPLTNQVPKPMVPVANVPVMQHIIELLRKHNIVEIASNLHYMPDSIRNYFGDGSRFDVEWRHHFEKELSGDAGGVRACKDFLTDETFIVLMGDLLTDADLSYVIAEHKKKGALASIALKHMDDVSQFGVAVTDDNGFITGFQEKPKPEQALSNYISTGIYVLEPEVFEYIPKEGTYGFGRQLFPDLVKRGLPVLGVPIDNYYWSDVGTIKQYRQSNFDVLQGKIALQVPYRSSSFGYVGNDARMSMPLIDGRLLLGNNSSLSENVTIRGEVVIGDNCRIESGAVLENTVVWSQSTVGHKAVLRNCVVASCTISDGTEQNEIASVSLSPQLR